MVDAIPEGRVMTYGDVAELVGAEGPRRVGRVMSEYGAATAVVAGRPGRWAPARGAGGRGARPLEGGGHALVGGAFGVGGSTWRGPGGTARRRESVSVACDGIPAC